MEFQSYLPSEQLKSTIAYYWTVKASACLEGGSQYRLIPDGYVDWIFHLKTPWHIKYSSSSENAKQYRSHLFSHTRQYIDVTIPHEDMYFFGVKFQPWAAGQLWDIDMSSLTDQVVNWSDFSRSDFQSLEEQINLAADVYQMIDATEKALLPKLNNYSPQSLDKAVLQIINNPVQPTFKYNELGQRRLEQKFKKEVGISPKLLHRTLRVNIAIQNMIASPDHSLTDICYESGFYDQSHFIRDFKKFTGVTPSDFMKNSRPDGDIFNLRA